MLNALIFSDADGVELDGQQDILTCGVCQKAFPLSEIVHFIQHKVSSCSKEHLTSGHCYSSGSDREKDGDDGSLPLSTINTRRPSISAPISGKKSSGSGNR